jgi:hypothetical protein
MGLGSLGCATLKLTEVYALIPFLEACHLLRITIGRGELLPKPGLPTTGVAAGVFALIGCHGGGSLLHKLLPPRI